MGGCFGQLPEPFLFFAPQQSSASPFFSSCGLTLHLLTSSKSWSSLRPFATQERVYKKPLLRSQSAPGGQKSSPRLQQKTKPIFRTSFLFSINNTPSPPPFHLHPPPNGLRSQDCRGPPSCCPGVCPDLHQLWCASLPNPPPPRSPLKSRNN